MTFFNTDFFQQWISIVTLCLLVVGTVAFVSIPAALERHPGELPVSTDSAVTRHLT